MAKTKVFDQHIDVYEKWFMENIYVYQSELAAVEKAIPKNTDGFEIGIGSGLFAKSLGIREGVEPSAKMREKAEGRDLKVTEATAENLPYDDSTKDFALMVTTICFVDDIRKSFQEAHRVLKPNGNLIIGFVDKNSLIGKEYIEHKNESLFYKDAIFYGTEEVYKILAATDFEVEETYQTVFGKLDEISSIQEVEDGYGEGSFVVIKAKKQES